MNSPRQGAMRGGVLAALVLAIMLFFASASPGLAEDTGTMVTSHNYGSNVSSAAMGSLDSGGSGSLYLYANENLNISVVNESYDDQEGGVNTGIVMNAIPVAVIVTLILGIFGMVFARMKKNRNEVV